MQRGNHLVVVRGGLDLHGERTIEPKLVAEPQQELQLESTTESEDLEVVAEDVPGRKPVFFSSDIDIPDPWQVQLWHTLYFGSLFRILVMRSVLFAIATGLGWWLGSFGPLDPFPIPALLLPYYPWIQPVIALVLLTVAVAVVTNVTEATVHAVQRSGKQRSRHFKNWRYYAHFATFAVATWLVALVLWSSPALVGHAMSMVKIGVTIVASISTLCFYFDVVHRFPDRDWSTLIN